MGVRLLKTIIFTAAFGLTAGFVYLKFKELADKDSPQKWEEDLTEKLEALETRTLELSNREPI